MNKLPQTNYQGNRSYVIVLYPFSDSMMSNYDVLFFVFQSGIDFCPGENVTGVTTHEQMNYTTAPVLFHLGRDPGEKYPIRLAMGPYHNI